MEGEKRMLLVDLYSTKVSKTILLACATTQLCISATCSSQLQAGRFIAPAPFNATEYITNHFITKSAASRRTMVVTVTSREVNIL